MTWLEHHRRSEDLASRAGVAKCQRKDEQAKLLYGEAAVAEVQALDALVPEERRMRGILGVSTVALYYKAGQPREAESTAYRLLAHDDLPRFAVVQFRDLLQTIWGDDLPTRTIASFASSQVNVEIAGDDIFRGGAPVAAVLNCIENIQSLLYRVAEFTKGIEHRREGSPSPEIRAACRSWVFQTVAKNFRFAVTVEDTTGQQDLIESADASPSRIVDSFLAILRASVESPETDLPTVVPSSDYRHTFLTYARALSPAEHHQLSVWSPPDGDHIVLDAHSRKRVSSALEAAFSERRTPRTVKGVLRAVDLDRKWLMVRDNHGSYRVDGVDEQMDEVIRPMVNREVVVHASADAKNTLRYKDIQAAEAESLSLFGE